MIGHRKLTAALNKRKNIKKAHPLFQKKIRKPKIWQTYLILGCTLFMSVTILLPTAIVQMKTTPVTGATSEEVQGSPNPEEAMMVSVKRSETDEVEKVALENYVYSVVASEMPANFEEEALKAQAVAARTYVIQKMYQSDSDMTDTTAHQVYKNEEELKEQWQGEYEANRDKIKRAVDATVGEIIMYEDEPITPTFFSMSNGYTENAEDYWGGAYPYLKSVESKWEESLPNFVEQQTYSFTELNDLLDVQLTANATPSIQLERTESNRVKQLYINDQQFTGREVREKLDLRSNDFTIAQHGGEYIFTTKGFGHGVGMSQYGANGMAEEGKTYDDILRYYYQQVDIATIEDLPKQALVALQAK